MASAVVSSDGSGELGATHPCRRSCVAPHAACSPPGGDLVEGDGVVAASREERHGRLAGLAAAVSGEVSPPQSAPLAADVKALADPAEGLDQVAVGVQSAELAGAQIGLGDPRRARPDAGRRPWQVQRKGHRRLRSRSDSLRCQRGRTRRPTGRAANAGPLVLTMCGRRHVRDESVHRRAEARRSRRPREAASNPAGRGSARQRVRCLAPAARGWCGRGVPSSAQLPTNATYRPRPSARSSRRSTKRIRAATRT